LLAWLGYRGGKVKLLRPGARAEIALIFESASPTPRIPDQTQLISAVPSFSREDEMPIIGRKYHMARHGVFPPKTALA
jgi:hypothetical protein